MKLVNVGIVIVTFYLLGFTQQASLTGKVTLNDGTTPVESLLVVIENNGTAQGECYTDVAGNYTMSITSGNYSQLRVRNLWRKNSNVPYLLEYTAVTNIVIADGINTQDISLPKFYSISGVVLTSKGDTIKGAKIECGTSGGFSPPLDYDSTSLVDGSYRLLNVGTDIRITITPPEGYNVQKSFFDITLMSDTIFNPILKVVTNIKGIVFNSRGDTIKGIGVTFEKIDVSWQKDTFTNEKGEYNVFLTPDNYNIRIRNSGMSPNLPSGKKKGVPTYLEERVLNNIAIEKDTTIDIILPFYPMIRCSVVTAEGNAASNIVLSTSAGSLPSTPPADYDTTDDNGICTLFVVPNLPFTLWSGVYPDLQTQFTNLTISKDTTLLIVLKKNITLSGKVYHSDSITPVKGVGIALEEGSNQIMTYTDSSGSYSINLASGVYRLRVRNSGLIPSSTVPQNLEHTVFEEVNLDTSKTINIILPYFPTISGKVYSSTGEPVSNVTLDFIRWDGYMTTPFCKTTSDNNGNYSIVIGKGVNKIIVTPPAGSIYGRFEFIESFDTSKTKNIYLPDKAKGITRVQPSVVTVGENGKIMINSINLPLKNVTQTSYLSLGDGIEIDSVKPISDITLFAYIRVLPTASTGVRDVTIITPEMKCIGPNLFTVTAPAKSYVSLNEESKTKQEIRIGDGTGTELIIPKGTTIYFPSGSDSVISYIAPILESDSVALSGKATEIQRELQPKGLVFGDTVLMRCQYSTQDVIGLDESTLKPYFYFNTDGKDSLGEEIVVVERDTTANTISIGITHFSIFKFYSMSQKTFSYINRKENNNFKTEILSFYPSLKTISFYISQENAKDIVTIELIDLQGRKIKTLVNGVIGMGTHRVVLDNDIGINKTFILILKTTNIRISKKIILLK